MTLPPVLRAAFVRRPPEEAFALFTEQMGAWWPLVSHGVFGTGSGGVAVQDGQVVERAVDGRTAVWAQVLAWEPPARLVLAWHPGRAGGPAGQVEVRFLAVEGGTRLELVHEGWEAFGERALAVRRAYSGPDAWGHVLDHYTDLADRVEPRPAAAAALAEAYETFFAEALRGGFAAPRPGRWTAQQVLAHVAVDDDALAASCRSLIQQAAAGAGGTASSGGEHPGAGPALPCASAAAADPAVLDAHVRGHGGDVAALVETGRARARQLLALLGRLDDGAPQAPPPGPAGAPRETPEGSPPWFRLALTVQLERHLPAHTAQLTALREGSPSPATAAMGG